MLIERTAINKKLLKTIAIYFKDKTKNIEAKKNTNH